MTQIEQTKIHRPQLLDIQAVVQASLLQLVAAVTVAAPVLRLQLVAAVTVVARVLRLQLVAAVTGVARVLRLQLVAAVTAVARVLRLVLAAMVREWLFLRVTLAHMPARAITVT